MVRLTRDVIRKKAEHHDGILGDLEEISLHQLEIERIETIGTLCRKLRILYLQNNIIPRIENLHHLKDLEYLNMALNNVTKIEGLHACEFLNKLDLTVNFIDVDTLEESLDNLQANPQLRELYLMGNPVTQWEGWQQYVTARLPWLEVLDGQRISRSDRIKADRRLPELAGELARLAEERRRERAAEAGAPPPEPDEEGKEAYTPAVRTQMYREIAEQKEEQEQRRRDMEPKERDYEREHAEAVERVRREEEERGGRVRQCNQGKWRFKLEDEDGEGNVVLEVDLPRHLDTSLIDLDVHPTWVSVVVKNKTLRLELPEEVHADRGSARRSTASGNLVVTMPKVLGRARTLAARRAAEEEPLWVAPDALAGAGAGAGAGGRPSDRGGSGAAAGAPARVKRFERPKTVAEMMLEEARQQGARAGGGSSAGDESSKAVDLRITRDKQREARRHNASIGLNAVATQRVVGGMA